MALGTAEPPITTRSSLAVPSPVWARWFRYMVQMVGTPPVMVTPSVWISSCRLFASILSQGSTNLQPLIRPAKGWPQAAT